MTARQPIIDSLKTQIKTLEFNLKERDSEISSLKKKTKVTKMDECILRLEIAEAEAMRLRNALEETQQRTKELKYTGGDQAVIIEKLKRKNKELSAELAKKREALNKQKEYDNTKYNKPEGASNKQIQALFLVVNASYHRVAYFITYTHTRVCICVCYPC